MSPTADPAALAAALDGVTDVTGYVIDVTRYDEPPAMMGVGDAWMRWGGFESGGPPLTFITTWRIDVDRRRHPGRRDALAGLTPGQHPDAIDTIVFITSVAPIEFQVPNPRRPIRGHRSSAWRPRCRCRSW